MQLAAALAATYVESIHLVQCSSIVTLGVMFFSSDPVRTDSPQVHEAEGVENAPFPAEPYLSAVKTTARVAARSHVFFKRPSKKSR